MTEWLERYLDLAALDAVGEAMLDPRPAFVASGDGTELLWANAAAVRLFRARDLEQLTGRRLGQQSLLRVQLSRLSRLPPADRSRSEALAFPLAPMPAACRRLNLADGTRAVLAIAEATVSAETLRGRAERLTAGVTAGDRTAAVLDQAGGYWPHRSGSIWRWWPPLRRSLQTRRRRGRLGGLSAPAGLAPTRWRSKPMARHCSLWWFDRPVWRRRNRSRFLRSGHQCRSPRRSPRSLCRRLPWRRQRSRPSRSWQLCQSPLRPGRSPLPTQGIASPAATDVAPPAERLSGSEADAFRRIREVLGRTDPRVALPPPSASTSATPVPPAAPSPPPAPPESAAATAAAPTPAIDETLLDRLAVGILIFRERRTLLANRALLDLLGFDSMAALAAAGGIDAVFADGTRAWANGDFDDESGRLAARKRDGTTVPIEARLNTVSFAGETAFMLTVTPRAVAAEASPATDVANLVGAERRIHDLEAVLNTATDGVLVVDRHGTIESMNRAAEALFAVEAGDFKGRSFTELFAEESRRAALDYLDGLAANGVASVLNDGREVIGKVPHGGLIPLSMTMGRIGDSGRFSAVVRDITHWKAVEEELTAARREAEAANNQKSEFLAKISHEIRTPLNAIIGFSEIMMEQRFGPIGNDRYRAYMNDIHVSGAHLMSLINDLLDLSKIEAGKVELTFESVAVNAVIQESVALMQPLANRERIIIRTSLSTDLPNVVADPRSLRQILLNLMSNAIKFTRAGGQVIVSTFLEGSGEVVVRIRDTGIGMSQKDIETAMKPFEQVTSAQGADKGTGLGLPLTKAMVEANRAAFAIESAPNQGTLVRITFPTTRVLAG